MSENLPEEGKIPELDRRPEKVSLIIIIAIGMIMVIILVLAILASLGVFTTAGSSPMSSFDRVEVHSNLHQPGEKIFWNYKATTDRWAFIT